MFVSPFLVKCEKQLFHIFLIDPPNRLINIFVQPILQNLYSKFRNKFHFWSFVYLLMRVCENIVPIFLCLGYTCSTILPPIGLDLNPNTYPSM